MEWNWLQNTLGEYLSKLVLWAKDGKTRFVLFVLMALFVFIVIIPKVSQLLANYDYIALATSVWSFIYSNSNTKPFVIALLLVDFLLVLFVLQYLTRSTKRTFEINIGKHPNIWSYYKGSGWSISEDTTSWNKVLKLTNCGYPAILKFGTEWLNYCYSFEAKIPSTVRKGRQNFSFVVRARDKGNNVFFQCKPDGTITPHLVTNGLFIIDKANEIKFLADFSTDKWVPVKVNVKGDQVTITMLGVSATYTIPSTRLVIPSDKVRSDMYLDEALELTKNSGAENSVATSQQAPKVAFDLDYEKGTVGFRESGEEVALFRKIKVELLQPFYTGVF